MDLFHGGSPAALEDAMRFRVARSAVLAGNLANVDTPGYRRREMHFADAMNQAVASLKRTDSSHMAPSAQEGVRHPIELGPEGTRPDGNGVNMDEEVIAFHRNSGAFT
ncbi:MAG: flagellar basal-body rod protein FlgB, partial [Myxococcota bacterium]